MSNSKEDQIIRAAIDHLSRNPGAPLEDIARHAGISRTTLFRYFPSRAKLFEKIILDFDHHLSNHLKPVLKEKIPALDMLHRITELAIEHNVQFTFLLYEPLAKQDPVVQSVISQAITFFQDLIHRLQQEGIIKEHINIHWAAKSLDMLLWIMGECINDGDVAVNAAPEMLVNTFLNGFSDPSKKADNSFAYNNR